MDVINLVHEAIHMNVSSSIGSFVSRDRTPNVLVYLNNPEKCCQDDYLEEGFYETMNLPSLFAAMRTAPGIVPSAQAFSNDPFREDIFG